MKHALKFTGAAAGLAMALAASGAALAQKSADTIRVAINDPFSVLDLYHFPQDEVGNFNRATFGTLIKYDEFKGQYIGELAKAWRRIDDRTIEFDLRDDVVFHSGNKFTAEDVKYTLDYLKDPKTKIRFVDRYNWVKEIQVISPYKLRYVSETPQSTDMTIVAYQHYVYDSAVHKTLDNPADYGRVSGSGTGPYKLVSIDRNDGVKLERFEKLAPIPHLRAPIKRIHGIWMPDKQTQVAQILTGGVDLIANVAPDMAKDLINQPNITSTARPSKQLLYITLDAAGRSANKAMTNESVRKAFIMAIDRESIIKNFVGGSDEAERPLSICFRSTVGCAPTTKPYGYDPAAAKKLLSEAGFADGLDITLYVFAPIQYIAVAIAGELRKVGIRATVEGLPLSAYVRKRGDGEFTAFLGAYPISGTPDVDNLMSVFFGGNRSYYADPLFDKVTQDALGEFDIKKRTAIYTPALDRVNQMAYILPLSEQPTLFAHTKEIKIAPSLYSAGSTRVTEYMWK